MAALSSASATAAEAAVRSSHAQLEAEHSITIELHKWSTVTLRVFWWLRNSILPAGFSGKAETSAGLRLAR